MPVERIFRKSAEQLLNATGNGVLLAVSGGADSMVMLHLFAQWQQTEAGKTVCPLLVVAHMNFSLRGMESDGDQALVEEKAKEYGLPIRIKKVDAASVARMQGVTTEMAARDLRYAWFEEVCREEGLSHIAVAHNANDRAETLLLNLIRGTGLKGLCSMRPKRGIIIRPMLEIPSVAIVSYAKEYGIVYRMDATNLETTFARNKIRHHVMPVLEQMVPGVVPRMGKNAEHLQQALGVLEELAEQKRKECACEGGFSIPCLLRGGHVPFWAYTLLAPYGFHPDQTAQIAQSLAGQSGKKFFSAHYALWIDRNRIIIRELAAVALTQQIVYEKIARTPDFTIPGDEKTVALDADKLEYPLTVRTPKPGDRFMPLGMRGFKKISDFLIDSKVPLYDKQKVQLLCSGNDIAWVVGMRIDERFKVTKDTTTIMLFRQKEGGPSPLAPSEE
ncbi:MAG: tRNA lysidine(34) synthetase TilS [Bacteroidales bacterium]|jgi:tRNA(Ile)-lysidine synthase